jgi:DNA-binding CsgD family transcriptional regulator
VDRGRGPVTEEAIAYAQRGRGERKRPASGWASLTSTERDVVRLVSEGLGNREIAIRLFVSPRTVQTHLIHVYTKLARAARAGSSPPRLILLRQQLGSKRFLSENGRIFARQPAAWLMLVSCIYAAEYDG